MICASQLTLQHQLTLFKWFKLHLMLFAYLNDQSLSMPLILMLIVVVFGRCAGPQLQWAILQTL